MPKLMKAAVTVEPGRIALDERPIPDIGPLDALIDSNSTTSKPQTDSSHISVTAG